MPQPEISAAESFNDVESETGGSESVKFIDDIFKAAAGTALGRLPDATVLALETKDTRWAAFVVEINTQVVLPSPLSPTASGDRHDPHVLAVLMQLARPRALQFGAITQGTKFSIAEAVDKTCSWNLVCLEEHGWRFNEIYLNLVG